MADMVIRGGTVIDGTGAEPFEADVAIDAGRIVAIGKIANRGSEEIDARGLLVTPGFVDPHTHYDGQATWSSPSRLPRGTASRPRCSATAVSASRHASHRSARCW